MGCEGMAEGVGRDALGEPCFPDRLIQRLLHILVAQMKPAQFLCFRDKRQILLRE